MPTEDKNIGFREDRWKYTIQHARPAQEAGRTFLVGIIPVADYKYSDSHAFGMIYPDCLVPLQKDITPLHVSIKECIDAGCNTIYIVSNYKDRPILREVTGDWAYDYNDKKIPITHLALTASEEDGRNKKSVVYATFWAANVAFWLSKNFRLWLMPTHYYVSFPTYVYRTEFLRKRRQDFLGDKGMKLVSASKKTICDDVRVGFSFTREEFIDAYFKFRKARKRHELAFKNFFFKSPGDSMVIKGDSYNVRNYIFYERKIAKINKMFKGIRNPVKKYGEERKWADLGEDLEGQIFSTKKKRGRGRKKKNRCSNCGSTKHNKRGCPWLPKTNSK